MAYHCIHCGFRIEQIPPANGVNHCPQCGQATQAPQPPIINQTQPSVPSNSLARRLTNYSNSKELLFLICIWGLIASLAASFLTIFASVLTFTFGELQWKVLICTFSLGVYSLIGLGSSTIWKHPRFHFVSVAGIGVAVVGGLFAVATNLGRFEDFLFVARMRIYILTVAISLAHIALLLNFNLIEPVSLWLRRITIVSIITLAFVILTFSIQSLMDIPFFVQLVSLVALVDVAGTLVVPLLHFVQKPKAEATRG